MHPLRDDRTSCVDARLEALAFVLTPLVPPPGFVLPGQLINIPDDIEGEIPGG